MSDWWVYENWTVEAGGRATVHDGKCPYCKHGEGIHQYASDRNGRWHGPFPTRDSAFAGATRLGRTKVRYCMRCCG